MTYVEGGAMFNERGGSNTLARHAFNELVSFVAGWAILIDYVIVIALIAITVPHYLSPISEDLATGTGEVVIALAIIAGVAAVNIRGYTGRGGQKLLVGMTVADLALQAALVVVGIAVVWDPTALTAELDLFSSPDVDDIAYALVISMVALAGIEAASNLAPDLAWRKEDLKNVLRAGGVVVPFVYVGMSFVALMALPVVDGPGGPETALATTFKDAPVLGVTMAFEPQWLADTMKWAVVAIAPAVLIFAARATMLGLSRHVYVMGRNRQIPSWLAKLGKRRSTPYVAITFAALMAAALALPGDVELLAGVFAFGALLAISIAHASLIRLRFTEPDLERPYRAPLGVVVRGVEVPLSAVLGLILTTIGLIAIAGRPRRRALRGGGLDGLRAGGLFHLPQGLRGDLADRSRRGSRAGPPEAGAGRRAGERARARLRRGAGRRDRLHRRTARRLRSAAGREQAAAGPALRDRAAADGSAGRPPARGEAGTSESSP